MELRHLRYFIAVAEELSFTRAARRLHLTQPSLTRQIRNLEVELGVRLLDRNRNQVSLTEEGMTFLVDAKRIVTLSLESVQTVQKRSRGETERLNVGYQCKFNFNFLPVILVALNHVCPEITVNLFAMDPAEQFRALESRKLDVGFVGLRPPGSSKISTLLDWECIAHHRVVVVLPETHPLAKKQKIALAELQNLFFVTMSETTHPGLREWLSGLCVDAGYRPRILQDVHLESDILTFVAAGLGVSLAREQIKSFPHPGVVFRPLLKAVELDYCIAWSRDNRSKALTGFIELVKKQGPYQPVIGNRVG
jgi:DNA-binding transcriptional LysR family regulator